MTNPDPDFRPKVTYTYTSQIPPENLYVLAMDADGVVAQGSATSFPPQAASASENTKGSDSE